MLHFFTKVKCPHLNDKKRGIPGADVSVLYISFACLREGLHPRTHHRPQVDP